MNHITVTLSFPRPMQNGKPADHLLDELLECLDKESHESIQQRLTAAVPSGVYVGVDPEKEARRFIRSLKKYARKSSWYYDHEKKWSDMERYSWSVEIRGHGFPHIDALRFFWEDLGEVIGRNADILLYRGQTRQVVVRPLVPAVPMSLMSHVPDVQLHLRRVKKPRQEALRI